MTGKSCFLSTSPTTWIVDSGATDHICHTLSLFVEYHVIYGPEHVITIPDGKQVIVTHIGTIHLNKNIPLKDVLFVPDFQFNLVSIPKICIDMNCSTTFTDNRCLMQSPSMRPYLLGNLRHALYCVDDTNSRVDQLKDQVTLSTTFNINYDINKAKLWHLRMGHIPFAQLRHLDSVVRNQCCDVDNVCQIFPMVRQTRLSFPHSSIKTISTFELLHVDTWGPYQKQTCT